MGSPVRRRRRVLVGLLAALGVFVAIPVICLGGITSFAAFMDLHGLPATMRIAVVGAVACPLVPLAYWICTAPGERRAAKAHKARIRALRADTRAHTTYLPRHSADSSPRGQR